MFELALQLAQDAGTGAFDVCAGPVCFDYPWGDNLADEGFVGALVYFIKRGLTAWENVEADRAMWNDADDP